MIICMHIYAGVAAGDRLEHKKRKTVICLQPGVARTIENIRM